MVVAEKEVEEMADEKQMRRQIMEAHDNRRDEIFRAHTKPLPKADGNATPAWLGAHAPSFSEIELAGEYEVVKVWREAKRGFPIVCATVFSAIENSRIDATIIDRAELPAIKVGRRFWLTKFTFGDSDFYRETLPR